MKNLSDIDVKNSVSIVNDYDFSRELAILAARASFNKKATDPKVLDLGNLIGITDYFVVCSASNDRQVKTIVDEVEMTLKGEVGVRPRAIEGLAGATWVLMDYGDIVVHVMSEEARVFYGLERLWSDAQLISWEQVA